MNYVKLCFHLTVLSPEQFYVCSYSPTQVLLQIYLTDSALMCIPGTAWAVHHHSN